MPTRADAEEQRAPTRADGRNMPPSMKKGGTSKSSPGRKKDWEGTKKEKDPNFLRKKADRANERRLEQKAAKQKAAAEAAAAAAADAQASQPAVPVPGGCAASASAAAACVLGGLLGAVGLMAAPTGTAAAAATAPASTAVCRGSR